MKAILPVFRLVVIFLALIQISWVFSPLESAKGPSIEFDTLVYNFGTIKKLADGTCRFSFVNKGDAPLLITKVSASCGCTVPSYPKTPILPGEKGKVSVQYNTKTIGVFSKTINVSTNDASNPTVVLTIKGAVVK